MNGEGAVKYEKDGKEDIKLGIYSDDTFKEKSQRLDQLGWDGFDKEIDVKFDQLRKNTPALPKEEVEKLQKEYEETYLTDNKVQIREMQQKFDKQEFN